MIRDIQRKYFEIWGNEEAQNTFLKGFLVVLAALFVIQSLVLSLLFLKKPILVAVGKADTQVLTLTPPSEDLLKSELERVLRHYAESHYTWDSTTVEKAHSEAAKYVASEFQKSFQAANAEQVKLEKEKQLSQKVYVSALVVDPSALTARVTLDRILSVDGLRAAFVIVLDLKFESGPRTPSNPEGIYITAEKVVAL